MQIQVIGLREYFSKKLNKVTLKDAFFENKYRADSVQELFGNIDKFIEQIPEEERYNLFYTCARCSEEGRGKLLAQHIIPFDIDGVAPEIDKSIYIDLIAPLIGRATSEMGIVASGNGLHFIIGLDKPIQDEDYFEDVRAFYKEICCKIDDALAKANLPGNADPVVFSKNRLMRLPKTLNKKPKGETRCELISDNIVYKEFDLIKLSGIPVVKYTDQISDEMLKHLPKPDPKGVLDGCGFLQWTRDNQEAVSEPQWYAMLSIVGRFEEGRDLAHAFSRGYSGYSERETDRKLTQSITSSGPRTCEYIATIHDSCNTCPNRGKCKSPIVLQSSEFIRTQGSGFYNVVIKSGIPSRSTPNFDDLLKYFEQTTPFISLADNGMNYVYEDNHWRYFSPVEIKAYAEEHFDPKPKNQACAEFVGKFQRNNIKPIEWFDIQGVVNFSNGVLDLSTMELYDHSPDFRFRYILPFPYDPKAECPRFDQFMEEITIGDEQVQSLLLEFMGYALSGIDASLGQKALILTGDGANGKSVFMDTLMYLAGKNNYSTLTVGKEISKLENRYHLDGKLFNISEETPTHAMMESSIFKAMVTGGTIQARKLYCDSYSMKNTAKLIMACNDLPPTGDGSYGMFRRLLIIPFEAKFTEDDPNYDPKIRQKLYAEATGIYNKAIKALLRLERSNHVFSRAAKVINAVENYRETNDNVSQWWRSCIIQDTDAAVSGNILFMHYKMECEMAGTKPENKISFGRRLRKLVNDDEKFAQRRLEGKVTRTLIGYKIAEGEEEICGTS